MSKETPLSKVSEEVKNLAATLKEAFEANVEDGNIVAPKDLWETAIEAAGVTPDQYKANEKAVATVINASRLAAGEIGNDLMKKDKDLERVGLAMPIGRNGRLNFDILRSRTSRNPQDGSEIVKMGATSTKFTQTFVAGKSGEGKLIGDHLSAQANEFFG